MPFDDQITIEPQNFAHRVIGEDMQVVIGLGETHCAIPAQRGGSSRVYVDNASQHPLL